MKRLKQSSIFTSAWFSSAQSSFISISLVNFCDKIRIAHTVCVCVYISIFWNVVIWRYRKTEKSILQKGMMVKSPYISISLVNVLETIGILFCPYYHCHNPQNLFLLAKQNSNINNCKFWKMSTIMEFRVLVVNSLKYSNKSKYCSSWQNHLYFVFSILFIYTKQVLLSYLQKDSNHFNHC